MAKQDIVIVSAVRTPIGKTFAKRYKIHFLNTVFQFNSKKGALNGGLASIPSHQLGSAVIKELLARSKVDAGDITEVILGQVLSCGQGQNPARQAAINAGLPDTVCAMGVNMVCGSGLKSVALAAQAIENDEIVIAGGQESMSQSVHFVHLRNGIKFGDAGLQDSMISDGLTDAFDKCHMGITAENVAKEFNISRAEQDTFALESQKKTEVAINNHDFDAEMVPIEVKSRKGSVLVTKDEHPKPETNEAALAKLRTAFIKDNGTVTAGNASGLNDGAAGGLLMSADQAAKRQLKPMASIVSWATTGVRPSVMGIGPISAVRKAVEKAHWQLEDVDLFELNEAFAAQSLAVVKELGVPSEKVNVCGGAIALGHPIGASGDEPLSLSQFIAKLMFSRQTFECLPNDFRFRF